MGARDILLLVVLGAIWGSSYVFLRVAGPSFGTFWLIDVRLLLAAVALAGIAAVSRRALVFRAKWWQFLLLGLVNGALPFVFITNAVGSLNASVASILNAFTPLSTAVVAAIWIHERFTVRKAIGFVLGLCGVAALVGWSPLPFGPQTLVAAGQALLATVCYGIGAVYTRVAFKGESAMSLTLAQQVGAFAVLLPTLAFAPLPSPTLAASLSVIALAVLCTAVAYIIFFSLIERVGPTRTLTVPFLVPFFSLLWGVIFLGEPVGPGIIVGLALILSAVVMVTGIQLPGRYAAAR